jgi:tyrosine aminotransferase
MIQLHPNSLVQAALPKILSEVGDDYFVSLKSKLRATSEHAFEKLSAVEGLVPIKATAAMYMMIKIEIEKFKDITDDLDFCKKLLDEQCCLVFPAHCFYAKDSFRIVICTSKEMIDAFTERVTVFCAAHLK